MTKTNYPVRIVVEKGSQCECVRNNGFMCDNDATIQVLYPNDSIQLCTFHAKPLLRLQDQGTVAIFAALKIWQRQARRSN